MAAEPVWTDPELAVLTDLMRVRSGLVFQPARHLEVETALRRVMHRVGVTDTDRFAGLLAEDGAVFDAVMAEVTVGETYFFREPAQFELINRVVVPAFRRERRGAQPLRAWSAACATGEEAYSVAIALSQCAIESQIIGTDISRERLAAARRARYRDWSMRGVPATIIDRYFHRSSNELALIPEVRSLVELRYLNLAQDRYPAISTGIWGMDLILCRNVLIYFDEETISRVARGLIETLSDCGWLLTGASDPPLSEFVACDLVQTEAGFAYRRRRACAGVGHPASAPRSEPQRDRPSLDAEAPELPAWAPQPRPAHQATPEADSGTPPANTVFDDVTDSPVAELIAAAYRARDHDRVAELGMSLPSLPAADSGTYVNVIRALANLGRLDDARRVCTVALEHHRSVAELHYLHAILLMEATRSSDAAVAARRALYLDRSMIVARLVLAAALSRGGDRVGAGRALAAAERLLTALPPEAEVPASDGELAGRLLEMTRVQHMLARDAVA